MSRAHYHEQLQQIQQAIRDTHAFGELIRFQGIVLDPLPPLPSAHNRRVQRQQKRKRARLIAPVLAQVRVGGQPLPTVLVTEILSFLFEDVTQKRPL